MHIEICVLGGKIVTDKSLLEEIEGKCVERVAIIRYADRFYTEWALERNVWVYGICFMELMPRAHVLIL